MDWGLTCWLQNPRACKLSDWTASKSRLGSNTPWHVDAGGGCWGAQILGLLLVGSLLGQRCCCCWDQDEDRYAWHVAHAAQEGSDWDDSSSDGSSYYESVDDLGPGPEAC